MDLSLVIVVPGFVRTSIPCLRLHLRPTFVPTFIPVFILISVPTFVPNFVPVTVRVALYWPGAQALSQLVVTDFFWRKAMTEDNAIRLTLEGTTTS